MLIAGIIAEYNPFHSGHAYHIRRTREISGCDYVVVCMSGSFTQRGEPASLSMYERAKAALMNGADAVVELPTLWAVRTADAFARGGVSVLGGIGCDILSFGTECADPGLLEKLAHIRICEPEEVSQRIKQALESGSSHARARGEAVADYLGISAEILNSPNLVLASEYITAIRSLGLSMKPLPIQRVGGYHDTDFGEFASASAIRAAWSAGSEEYLRFLPKEEGTAMRNEKMHSMDDILLYRLREMSEAELAELPDAAEGLDKRLMNAALACGSREELIMAVKCKRYTYSRISRMCAHALLGITHSMTRENPLPEYVRLIGARKDALPLLKELKHRAVIPLESDPRKLRGNEVFKLDARAFDIRGLLCESNRQAGGIFTQKFIMI